MVCFNKVSRIKYAYISLSFAVVVMVSDLGWCHRFAQAVYRIYFSIGSQPKHPWVFFVNLVEAAKLHVWLMIIHTYSSKIGLRCFYSLEKINDSK